MAAVVAVLHEYEGQFGITFPDFPSVVSGGSSAEEALRRGRETLLAHMEALLDNDIPLPEIRSLDALRGDPEAAELFEDAALVALVEVEPPGRAVRVNVSFDEHLLARIDREAASNGETRSGFLAAAARARLSR